MSDWKTVIQVDTVQEAHLIRTQLDLEGFEARILDELSTQVAPHFTYAGGGARIQVPEKDWKSAFEYLTELGHIYEDEEENSNWLSKLTAFTLKIPFLRKLRIEARVLVFVSLVLLAIIVPIAISNIPPEESLLANTAWCVVEVKHRGIIIEPEPQELVLMVNGCSNYISFRENQSILLPSFGDNSVRAKWQITDNQLKFVVVGSPSGKASQNVLLGKFNYSLKGNELHLKSKETSVILVREYY